MSTAGGRLRRGREDDAAALDALERALYTGDRESADDWRAHMAHPHREVWLAEDADGPIAALLLFHGRTNTRIVDVSVAKRAQGQGWGRRLLRHAERRAKAKGKARLTLEVRPDNARAQAVYQAYGFKRIGTRKAFYEDGADAVRMAKPLT